MDANHEVFAGGSYIFSIGGHPTRSTSILAYCLKSSVLSEVCYMITELSYLVPLIIILLSKENAALSTEPISQGIATAITQALNQIGNPDAAK